MILEILVGLVIVDIVINVTDTKAILSLSDRISHLEDLVLLTQVPQKEQFVEEDVATGLVKGLQKMKSDDQKHLKLIELARTSQKSPMGIMNHSSTEEILDTGGDLIPANLSKEERDVLKMFYDKSN